MTNWYYLPGKTVLDLLLIIARSSAAIKITAGKLIHISIYTFGDVSMFVVYIDTIQLLLNSWDRMLFQMMKSAFAYLNLLRQRT